MRPTFFFIAVLLMVIPQEACAFYEASIQGQADFKNNRFELVLGSPGHGILSAKVDKRGDNEYTLVLNCDHFSTEKFDFSGEIQSSFGLSENMQGRFVKGKVWSKYSLLDYKPVSDLSGQFAIIENRLHFIGFSFAETAWSGAVGLLPPFKLDLTVQLNGVGLDDFLDFWITDKDFSSSGDVSGEIKVSGELAQPVLRGRLQTYNGFVKSLNFDSIFLNVEGPFPLLKIAKSTISKKDGMSFTIDGDIDLSDQENFKKQLEALTISPLVSNTNSGREWTLKRLEEDKSTKTEIKYLLRNEPDAGSAMKDPGSDMFGIQKSMEF